MHKAIESVMVVLFAVGFYIGLPALMGWGWVRWFKRTQPRTLPSILSLIGFALATASGLLAVSSLLYAHMRGGFPYYDPLLMGIYAGKERDTESGLDDFDARYYSSNLGRFMSSDWSAIPAAVPYADFRDPQSINLYTYVRNNPISRIDSDGHGTIDLTQWSWSKVGSFAVGYGKGAVNLAISVLNTSPPGIVANMLAGGKPGAGVIPQLQPSNQAEANGMVGATIGAAIAIPAAGAEGTAASESGILENAAKGAAFQNAVAAETAATNSEVVQNVTLETQSGVRTVMDVVSKDSSGNVVLTEAKSSATARLTPNQAAAHPEIAQTGATVVGQGKPGYPGGTKIPPTKVNVVRP
jgi:RHS repeat-associated protein